MRWRALLAANAAAALVTVAVSTAVLADPAFALPPGMAATPGAAFYAAATSLRSIALAGVLLVVLVRAVRSPRAPLAPLLVVTGLVQLADAVLHLAHGVAAPAACALLLAGVALGSVPATRRGRRGIKRDVRALTWEHD